MPDADLQITVCLVIFFLILGYIVKELMIDGFPGSSFEDCKSKFDKLLQALALNFSERGSTSFGSRLWVSG